MIADFFDAAPFSLLLHAAFIISPIF